jgi:uncharacterized protein (TIGR02145 family)
MNYKRWKKWSAPSKLTAIGAFTGIISIFLSIIFYLFSINPDKSNIIKFRSLNSSKKIDPQENYIGADQFILNSNSQQNIDSQAINKKTQSQDIKSKVGESYKSLKLQKIDSITWIDSSNGNFIDHRDNHNYRVVKVGTQVWMAENLNFTMPNTSCNRCETYALLYTYEAALNACPSGWHLPSDIEWTMLTNHLGGEDVAGEKLKSTNGWKSVKTGLTNSSGFTALPGGCCDKNGDFYRLEWDGNWWSSTESSSTKAWNRYVDGNYKFVGRNYYDKAFGFSVRCVRN